MMLPAYQLRQGTPPDLMPEDVPLEPLPRSHVYQSFAGYPKVAVDAVRVERERLREAEEQLLARRQVGTGCFQNS